MSLYFPWTVSFFSLQLLPLSFPFLQFQFLCFLQIFQLLYLTYFSIFPCVGRCHWLFFCLSNSFFCFFSLFNATYFQPLCLYLCMECNPIGCEVLARMPFHKELLMGPLCCTLSISRSFSLLMNLICVNLEYPPLTSTLCRR